MPLSNVSLGYKESTVRKELEKVGITAAESCTSQCLICETYQPRLCCMYSIGCNKCNTSRQCTMDDPNNSGNKHRNKLIHCDTIAPMHKHAQVRTNTIAFTDAAIDAKLTLSPHYSGWSDGSAPSRNRRSR